MGIAPQEDDDVSEITFVEEGGACDDKSQNYANVMNSFLPTVDACAKKCASETTQEGESESIKDKRPKRYGLDRCDTFVGYDQWDAPIMSLAKTKELVQCIYQACNENSLTSSMIKSPSVDNDDDDGELVSKSFGDLKSISPLKHSELLLGTVLGKGSFSSAYELQSIRFDVESASSNSSASEPEETTSYSQDQRLARARMQAKSVHDSASYVVKVLQPKLAHFPKMLASCAADLAKEGAILATLQHPHIIRVHGWTATGLDGFTSGRHDSFFLVLDRLHETLAVKLRTWQRRVSRKSKRRWSSSAGPSQKQDRRAGLLRERLTVIVQLADALAYLHSNRIVHRDLKPDNIGFDRETGNLKVFDFDLARQLPNGADTTYSDTFLLTQQVGSPRYMSPECARGDPYNLASDVYSFGLLAHEILSLAKPFEKIDAADIDDAVVRAGVRPTIPWTWPSVWQTVLLSCWTDVVADRLEMKDVHELLKEQMAGLLNDVPRCFYIMDKNMKKALNKSKRGIRASLSEFGAVSLRSLSFRSGSRGSTMSASPAVKRSRKRPTRRLVSWLGNSHHSMTLSEDSAHYSNGSVLYSSDGDINEFIGEQQLP